MTSATTASGGSGARLPREGKRPVPPTRSSTIPDTRSASPTGLDPDPAVPDSRTLDEYRDLLLGGAQVMSARELAQACGQSLEQIENYWLEMGFPLQDVDDKQFTEGDAVALRSWSKALRENDISSGTEAALTRAQSHVADRLVLWEMEALVEEAERRLDLDDTSARVVAIHALRHIVPALEAQLVYSWRRQMYSLIERTAREIASRDRGSSNRRFPLTRALGFVDMESYTYTASLLGHRLVGLIEQFEYVCRTAVTAAGGRVVKMIGDSVFFIADDLEGGLRVVTNLLDTLKETEGLLPVRASLVYGHVFSRSGDVFGPPVNLAARLVDVAPTGRVLTDAPTAAAIAQSSLRKEYRVEDFPPADLRGFGKVFPFLVSRNVDTTESSKVQTPSKVGQSKDID